MTGNLRFSVLGPLRYWRDGVEVGLGTTQQRAVLGILLLRQGHTITGPDLVTAVWGPDAPPAAVANLRTYISRLRRVLRLSEPEAEVRIESRAGSYALSRPPGLVDLDQLQTGLDQARSARERNDLTAAAAALDAALELSTGELLSGLAGPYIEAERESLEQRLLTARIDRCEIDLESGAHDDSVSELQSLTAEYPFREHLHELLMLALYRSGRQAEALAVYDHVRRELATELGVDPSPGLQRMYQDVLGQSQRLLPAGAAAPAAYPIAVDRTAGPRPVSAPADEPAGPNQLPADLADFTGRQPILADLARTLRRSDTVPVVAITGPGGVGKTALAVRAAHQVRDHFPDGQLFVSLDWLADRPATPFDVLGSLLKSLPGEPEPLPPTVAGRAAQWRSTLAGRRLLLVLDDAADYGQVRDLLPAMPGCAVIITARRRLLELPGVAWIDLEVFTTVEAVTLLGRIAGPDRVTAEPEAIERATVLCSHLPYALRYFGARLAARPSWSVAEMVDRVADGLSQVSSRSLDRDALIEPIVRGYRHLDPVQSRALRLLAGSPEREIHTATAAATLQLPEDQTETILESLADAHLIEARRRSEYQWRDLVRLFARQQYFLEDRRVAWPLRPSRPVRQLFDSAARPPAATDPNQHATAV